MTNAGGEVIIADKWDKRRLAYEIKDRREGIYVLMYFRAEPAVATELNRVMRISEDCIRHIIVLDEGGQAETAKEKLFKLAVLEAAEEEEITEEETEETEAVSVEEESGEAVELGEVEAEEAQVDEMAEGSEPEPEAEAESGSEPAESEAETETAESREEE